MSTNLKEAFCCVYLHYFSEECVYPIWSYYREYFFIKFPAIFSVAFYELKFEIVTLYLLFFVKYNILNCKHDLSMGAGLCGRFRANSVN